MRNASAFVVGILFAIGLGISGMTQPEKVIGFLDLFGDWDASLAFVMAGAVLTYTIFFRLLKRQNPFFERAFQIPSRRDIDARLLVGAVLFGVGWGIAGYCPGPALTSLGGGQLDAVLFVAAMLAGMTGFALLEKRD